MVRGAGVLVPSDAVIHACGTVVAAAVIAAGALLAAGSFEPKFIRWGNNVANIEHIILVGEQDDGSGCSVILSTTVARVFETPTGTRTGLSGHTVENDFECEAIRRAVRKYTIDGRQRTDEK